MILVKERVAAVEKYNTSMDRVSDLLQVYTDGFDSSLEKVRLHQPDFPIGMIILPPEVSEFKDGVGSGSSSARKGTMAPPEDKSATE